MIYIEIVESGERLEIENQIWVTTNRNGIVVTPHRIKAAGVGDGTSIWSLGELEGFQPARIITFAEYMETQSLPDEDPKLSAEEALNIILGGNHESE
jgi:hypothetical protein